MGKIGSLGKAKIESVVEKIYWMEKIGGRGRKERLWDVVGIEFREVLG